MLSKACVQRIDAIALAVGVAMLVWIWGKGNQQIIALPLALWLIVSLWPRHVPAGIRQNEQDARCHGFCLARVHWFTTAMTLLVWGSVVVGAWANFPTMTTNVEEIGKKLDAADTLAGRGRFEEGLTLLKSLAIPDNMPIQKARRHHNCGVFLVRLQRPAEALEQFRLSLKYDRANVQAAYMVAVLTLKQGQHKEAERMTNIALSIAPDYTPALQLRQAILAGTQPRTGARGVAQ